uniref:Ig-like domain-containing protein n=1 Tax=Amphiprion percula TaxID=161767 RepID=A0A3P8T9B2_AMPPE
LVSFSLSNFLSQFVCFSHFCLLIAAVSGCLSYCLTLCLSLRTDGVPAPLLSWVLLTLPSDRGVYRCVASNSAGAASASVRVHVSSLPPVIQQPREEHLLLSPGRPVYAHCSARGAPPPTLRWRIPDGTLVRPSQFLHGNLFVLPNGTLHIRKVGLKESGSYECTASNAVGASKRTVKVEIEGATGGEKRQGVAINEGTKDLPVESQTSSVAITAATIVIIVAG